MNREEKKKVKHYRKKEMNDEAVISIHRDLPQMCAKYLTKNDLW